VCGRLRLQVRLFFCPFHCVAHPFWFFFLALPPVRPQTQAASPVRPQTQAASPVRPQTQAASPVRRRRRATSPIHPDRPVPFNLPPEDLVPNLEMIPEVPLRGSTSAPLDAFLAWRAEIDAATFQCSNTAAEVRAASSATAATKAALEAAMAAHSAATDQESNAKARSSTALKRRRFAWDQYLTLRAEARLHLRSGSGTASRTPSMVSLLPPPVEKGNTHVPSSHAAEDANDLNDDAFQGLSVDLGYEAVGTEEMEL